jgi:hypothetical protein
MQQTYHADRREATLGDRFGHGQACNGLRQVDDALTDDGAGAQVTTPIVEGGEAHGAIAMRA